MTININFIFTLGYRCYATDFLNTHNLRKMSGPFDYLIIDFETAIKIISNKFSDFTSDIIYSNKNKNQISLFYKKNTTYINDKIIELLKKDIVYMNHCYNHMDLFINQNYLDINKINNNLYYWDNICLFMHHNLLDKNNYDKINMRCERFNNIINKYESSTALFYITKIVNYNNNIFDYINNIIKIKELYNINSYIIMIINCDNVEQSHYFYNKEKCLFIIRNVENYETQKIKYEVDNSSTYHDELKIIFNYFTFNLIEKNDI